MTEGDARIRLYEASDDKLVKFSIGKASMEGLAVANRSAFFHPFTLSAWVGLSCIMIQYLNWWPKPEYGLLGYLAPLPAFGSWGAVMLYLMDWFNRPHFEDASLDLLRRPDVADIANHYRRSPSSGFFILEYSKKFVGLIAIDASKDSQSQDTLMDKDKGKPSSSLKSKHAMSQGTSSVATIRHFYIEEPYRRAGIQEDLLAHAIQHTFKMDNAVKEIKVTTTSLIPYVQKCIHDAGFALEKPVGKVGIYGWKFDLFVLRRAHWNKQNAGTVS
ncbi:hypothetical protein DEU56DRAFT_868418 [Suillus clintonianus]|uniref:uncharacterized protein n=1 Tax=Suillus clintonianus TaxID=1904413 RepID=UPI001B8841A8|nr:uncharacterized protein DEU56DRAFT_868418 [Suillus clintonianus]KAG2154890.1 hypothetical protein DEU56DRAFT_868418 [Suillus clintonianus]